ncbi:MAG TPA: hypothetical protein ACFYD2_11960 [Candidatus Avalokitesvara rifleensis]|uniref:hypothetical protein n=1 Tax=Candidatus Avalokitesvara rifleensis TaxID=3367620 RepID=UPI004026EEDA
MNRNIPKTILFFACVLVTIVFSASHLFAQTFIYPKANILTHRGENIELEDVSIYVSCDSPFNPLVRVNREVRFLSYWRKKPLKGAGAQEIRVDLYLSDVPVYIREALFEESGEVQKITLANYKDIDPEKYEVAIQNQDWSLSCPELRGKSSRKGEPEAVVIKVNEIKKVEFPNPPRKQQ